MENKGPEDDTLHRMISAHFVIFEGTFPLYAAHLNPQWVFVNIIIIIYK